MKNFLEELYCGNLESQVRAIKPNAEVKSQTNVLDNAESELKSMLICEVKDLFSRYV